MIHADLRDQSYCLFESSYAASGVTFKCRQFDFDRNQNGEVRIFTLPLSADAASLRRHGLLAALLHHHAADRVLSDLLAMIEQHVVVSPNSAYDFYIIEMLSEKLNLPQPTFPVVDPFYMARALSAKKEEGSADILFLKYAQLFIKQKKTTLSSILPYSRPKPITHAFTFHHQLLQDAFLRSKNVILHYPKHASLETTAEQRPRQGLATEARQVEILGFRAPFFVGYCHLRKDMRTFRIDRVQEIELTQQSPQYLDTRVPLGSFLLTSRHPAPRTPT